MTDCLTEAEAHLPYTQSLRRDLHVHPELGIRELLTNGMVARSWRISA
jgi:metal-dependent amidase/aminoacylase/carboxypeptidase family protein